MSLYYPIKNKKSIIDGTGAFALSKIPARKKIGNIAGEIISKKEARKRAIEVKRVAIVEFWDQRALDATFHSNELKYINHSCKPNTYLRVCYDMIWLSFILYERLSKVKSSPATMDLHIMQAS